MAYDAFRTTFSEPIRYNYMIIRHYLHEGLRHAGGRVTTSESVIRHQHSVSNYMIGGILENHPQCWSRFWVDSGVVWRRLWKIGDAAITLADT